MTITTSIFLMVKKISNIKKAVLIKSTLSLIPLFFKHFPHLSRLEWKCGACPSDSETQVTHLQTGLRVGGQEGLSGARQEGLARRDEGPLGCGPRLAEVQETHWPRRLEGWPHGPLSGEHRLLPLLTERWAGLGEGQGTGRGHRVTTAEDRGRRRRWGGTSLLQEEMAREPWLTWNWGELQH